MANDNFTQAALANDPAFRRRLKGSLARIAFQVLTEVGNPNHTARKAYALSVLANPDNAVSTLAGIFVFRTNLFTATTSVQFDGIGGVQVITAATDAALDSQLSTDWDNLSGV